MSELDVLRMDIDRLDKEIAELLGIKENSSTSLLRRAKDLLAKKIKEYNKQYHPR